MRENWETLTVKKAIYIGITASAFQVLLNYGLIKANGVGTFDVGENIRLFIFFAIFLPIALIIFDKLLKILLNFIVKQTSKK